MKKMLRVLIIILTTVTLFISGCTTPTQLNNQNQNQNNTSSNEQHSGSTLLLTASKTLLDQSPGRNVKDSTILTMTLTDNNGKPMKGYSVLLRSSDGNLHFLGDNPVKTDTLGKAEVTAELDYWIDVPNPTSKDFKDTIIIVAYCETLGLYDNITIDVDSLSYVTLFYSGTSDVTFAHGSRTGFHAKGIKILFAVNDADNWFTIFKSSTANAYAAEEFYAFNLSNSKVKRGSTVYFYYDFEDDPAEIQQTYLHMFNSWMHNVTIIPSFQGTPTDERESFSYRIP